MPPKYRSFFFDIAGTGIAIKVKAAIPVPFEQVVSKLSPAKQIHNAFRVTIVPGAPGRMVSPHNNMKCIVRKSITGSSLELHLDSSSREAISAAVGYGISVALSVNRGTLIHAGGLLLDRKAYVFLAPSGGGKSTVLANCSRGICIHDDKIAVARNRRGWLAGSVPLLDNNGQVPPITSAPLGGMFIMKKAKTTRIVDLQPKDSFLCLASLSHEPTALPWIRKHLLETLLRLTNELPVRLLHYRKGDDVSEKIKRL